VHTQDNRLGTPEGVPTQGFVTQTYPNQGFTTEDILWALGIWSVIICLSPVIVFYMLMVA
jgi:hypothetical protein